MPSRKRERGMDGVWGGGWGVRECITAMFFEVVGIFTPGSIGDRLPLSLPQSSFM